MKKPATPEKMCLNCSLLHTRWGETCRERLMVEVRALRERVAALETAPPSSSTAPRADPDERIAEAYDAGVDAASDALGVLHRTALSVEWLGPDYAHHDMGITQGYASCPSCRARCPVGSVPPEHRPGCEFKAALDLAAAVLRLRRVAPAPRQPSRLPSHLPSAPGPSMSPDRAAMGSGAPRQPSEPADECPRGGRHSWAREVFDVNDDTRSTGRVKCLRCGEFRNAPAPAPARQPSDTDTAHAPTHCCPNRLAHRDSVGDRCHCQCKRPECVAKFAGPSSPSSTTPTEK
jgi:hypothetical protein